MPTRNAPKPCGNAKKQKRGQRHQSRSTIISRSEDFGFFSRRNGCNDHLDRTRRFERVSAKLSAKTRPGSNAGNTPRERSSATTQSGLFVGRVQPAIRISPPRCFTRVREDPVRSIRFHCRIPPGRAAAEILTFSEANPVPGAVLGVETTGVKRSELTADLNGDG